MAAGSLAAILGSSIVMLILCSIVVEERLIAQLRLIKEKFTERHYIHRRQFDSS